MATPTKPEDPHSLGWRQQDHPGLYAHYARKLLQPGWAGELTDAEAAYIAREISARPELQRLWQTRRFTRYRRRITPTVVHRMAATWAQNPPAAIEGPATASLDTPQGPQPTNETQQEVMHTGQLTLFQ